MARGQMYWRIYGAFIRGHSCNQQHHKQGYSRHKHYQGGKVMRITIEKDMLEMVRGQEKQFLYSSARVRCVSLFEYEFFSYVTPMFKARLTIDGWIILKTSGYRSNTTFQHVRKFFNMIAHPYGYYAFKRHEVGDEFKL